jgi:hypothetical protein
VVGALLTLPVDETVEEGLIIKEKWLLSTIVALVLFAF